MTSNHRPIKVNPWELIWLKHRPLHSLNQPCAEETPLMAVPLRRLWVCWLFRLASCSAHYSVQWYKDSKKYHQCLFWIPYIMQSRKSKNTCSSCRQHRHTCRQINHELATSCMWHELDATRDMCCCQPWQEIAVTRATGLDAICDEG